MHKTLLWAGLGTLIAVLVWLETRTCREVRIVHIVHTIVCAENVDHQRLKALYPGVEPVDVVRPER
jgi:hypothetical protein